MAIKPDAPVAAPGGRYLRSLPKLLAERYREAAAAGNAIDLTDDLALIDFRIGELLSSLGETGSTRLWREVRNKLDQFKGAGDRGRGSVAAARTALHELEAVVSAGLTAAATWEELRALIDLRRRVSEAEAKRQNASSRRAKLPKAVATWLANQET